MQNTLLIWLTSPFLLGLAAFFIFALIPISYSFNPNSSLIILFIIATVVAIPLCPFGVVTALNVGIALLLLPWLLKILFGIETIFSISGEHVMNSTFFAVVFSLCYLFLDPLMKACYCLRCFYGESIQTGEDLKVELRSRARLGPVAALLIALLLIFAPFNKSLAQSSHAAVSGKGNPISAQQLNSAIETIIHYPEYSWRLPRERPPEIETKHSAFYDFIDSIINTLKTGWSYIKKGLSKAWNFIKKILSRVMPPLPKLEKPDSHWTAFSRVWIIIPLSCIVIVLAFLTWKAWRNRRARTVTAEVAAQSPPDITREDLDATALPEEGWVNLAAELMEKGELRLALRAFYLAMLAYLARQEFITLAKYKSDREYELELRRRSHSQPLLAVVFAENRALFENGWYGLHEVTHGIMERFSQNQEEIRTHAQR